jgi:elongator complex protein 1
VFFSFLYSCRCLQLWHRSNWHWYLKHEQLSSLPDSAGCLSVSWDEALPGRLHLMAGSGSYSVLDMQWDVAISSRGTAAVVDGHTLLITPLRWAQRTEGCCCIASCLLHCLCTFVLAWLTAGDEA